MRLDQVRELRAAAVAIPELGVLALVDAGELDGKAFAEILTVKSRTAGASTPMSTPSAISE